MEDNLILEGLLSMVTELKEKKAATFSFITLQFRQKDLKH